MANESYIHDLLIEAEEKGHLEPREDRDRCLAESINTANYFLYLIKEAGMAGLDNRQLENRTKMNINTCKIYCRVLSKMKKISKSKEGIIVIWRLNEKD